MGNYDFDISKLPDIPKIDLSYIPNSTSVIAAQVEENNKRMQEMADEVYKNRKKMQDNIEQTAINTAETNVQLEKVVKNQNDYIDVLKNQLFMQKKQLELDEQQLVILKNIFASGEDGVSVEKEIMKFIQNQIDSSHPLWDYVKDKGGDIAVAGVTAGAPVIYGAIKMYLLSKGIVLP